MLPVEPYLNAGSLLQTDCSITTQDDNLNRMDEIFYLTNTC
jgi:hypothetical protein